MSGKSKKTTADKTINNQKQTKYLSHSASKANRLSLSFYAENTLKMEKQIILDTYDQFSSEYSPLSRQVAKPTSYSKAKIIKPKTPIIRFLKQQHPNPKAETNFKATRKTQVAVEKKQRKSISRQRSSSRSSRGKSRNSALFNYIANRLDGSAKGWNALKPVHQIRNNYIKKI